MQIGYIMLPNNYGMSRYDGKISEAYIEIRILVDNGLRIRLWKG